MMPQYFNIFIIMFVCSEVSNSKLVELPELYTYWPTLPVVKAHAGEVGLNITLMFIAFGCGLTFISTELFGPVPVVHKGYCTVGAVNEDLVILEKSL